MIKIRIKIHLEGGTMYSQWLDNVAMFLRCTYGADLQALIKEDRVSELRIMFEGGVSEESAADAIAEVCWL
jgi:hypothetical protein